ncbi:acyltransferase [Taibaiella sp. KBW10]|uniref:acyltransferase family protein n=1 Tax=Taibaiella sp. KBW10 TaxID=2153357 RepID=UPI000F58F8BE|nr:acyltransferase [Taibaiella sp. KBW10]RQO31394.1 acyltransferase [Taibaiella sp. KBW10]
MAPQQTHRNNFDFLRLLLASFVIISHSYALLGLEAMEPLRRLTGSIIFSGIGVGGFFVLSGFLIYQSVLNSASLAIFVKKRFWRIFPALVTVVLFATFILGAVFTQLPLLDYLSQKQTYSYLIKNIFLIPSDNILPGVFRQNHRPEINGSLWTLRYEVLCYAGMLLYFLIPLKRHKSYTLIAYGFLLAGDLLLTYKPTLLPDALQYHLSNFFSLTTFFYTGVLLAQWQQVWKPYCKQIFIASLLLFVGLGIFKATLIAPIAIWLYPLLILSFGLMYNPSLQIGKKIGDISYGTYIYAYPIQQMLIAIGIQEVGTLMLLSFICSWIAGWLSFHLIEKRFLYKQKRIS